MRLVLTGGGTMGHVLPNVAVIEELKKQCALKDEPLAILYVGSYKGPERSAIEGRWQNVKFKAVFTGKLRRYFSLQNFVDIFKIPLGILQAIFKLLFFIPKVVFSKGGYVSLPVCVAAWLLRIPVILHESDVTPGLANKISAKFAKIVCVSFKETKKYFKGKKVLVTGNLVRQEVLEGDKKLGYEVTHLEKGKKVLLVMGGSQGAKQINSLIRENLDELLKDYTILHIVGKDAVLKNLKQKSYKQFEYVAEDLKHFYAMADYFVSRGGANSLAEIGALGKPVLIIPLTHVGRGDQVDNARVFTENNAAIVLKDDKDFTKSMKKLASLKSTKQKKQTSAAREIVKLLL